MESASKTEDRGAKSTDDLTALLNRMADGDVAAQNLVFRRLYSELHRIASGVKRRRARDGTLDATELIHLAYTRLVRKPKDGWKGRGHFLATAARAMWQVLVDYIRKKKNFRAGGSHKRAENVNLDQLAEAFEKQTGDLVRFDGALQRLRTEHPMNAQIVELKFFGDFSMEQIAEMLGMGLRSVQREWTFAKAWLKKALG